MCFSHYICIVLVDEDGREDISGFVGGIFEDDIISSTEELKRFILDSISRFLAFYLGHELFI